MSFDLSFLLPMLAVVVSIGAAVFWDGSGGKGERIEKYIAEKIVLQTKGTIDAEATKFVRIEIEPGQRLKPSDLRARDRQEHAGEAHTIG